MKFGEECQLSDISGYSNRISEAEDYYRDELRRVRTDSEERLDEIEETYREDLVDREEEVEETADSYREQNQRLIARQKEIAQEEVKSLKRELYDRYGKVAASEAKIVKDQLDVSEKERKSQLESSKVQLNEAAQTYEDRLGEINREFDERMDKNARIARDSALTAYNELAEDEGEALMQARKEQQAEYQRTQREQALERNNLRREAQRMVDEVVSDYSNQMDGVRRAHDVRNTKAEKSLARRLENTIKTMNDAHSQEAAQLRTERDDVLERMALEGKGYADGMANAIRDYNEEHRQKIATIQELTDNKVAQLSEANKATERHLAGITDRAIRENEEKFTRIINQNNKSALFEKNNMATQFEYAMTNLQDQSEAEKEMMLTNFEERMSDAAIDRENALKNQARVAQDTLRVRSESLNDRIDQLEADIQLRTTSPDPNFVSPSAEENIRNGVIREYEKVFSQNQEQEQREFNAIQQSHYDDIQTIQNNHAQLISGREQQLAGESEQQKRELLQVIHELEMQNTEIQQKQAGVLQRQEDQLSRNYQQIIDRMERVNEENANAMRTQFAGRLRELREEADFSEKMAQRDFNLTQAETNARHQREVREMEDDYEALLDHMKAETSRQLRELDLTHKNDMSLQAQTYEHQIRQLEQQMEEKERNMVLAYEDQLEKVRRANARLAQKTG